MSAGVAIERRPLSAQLRSLVIDAASEATLSCEFRPGGRVRGAGVVSHFHCANCNQPRMWHVVAEAIPALERDEETRAGEDDRCP